jgi:hypothetical protein
VSSPNALIAVAEAATNDFFLAVFAMIPPFSGLCVTGRFVVLRQIDASAGGWPSESVVSLTFDAM